MWCRGRDEESRVGRGRVAQLVPFIITEEVERGGDRGKTALYYKGVGRKRRQERKVNVSEMRKVKRKRITNCGM